MWRNCAVIVAAAILGAQESPRLRPLPKASLNFKTGPEVGATVPPFALQDQYGAPRNFDNLRGRTGLVLVFVRSADW
jgi:cytochrome oxidase Cu insertion factor (SCO1/SenC/PrrC family)